MKATYAVVNGEERMLFKDPKTDDGTKKSQRGRVVVFRESENGDLIHLDGMNKEQAENSYSELEVVFENGVLKRDQSLSEIREILAKQRQGVN